MFSALFFAIHILLYSYITKCNINNIVITKGDINNFLKLIDLRVDSIKTA